MKAKNNNCHVSLFASSRKTKTSNPPPSRSVSAAPSTLHAVHPVSRAWNALSARIASGGPAMRVDIKAPTASVPEDGVVDVTVHAPP